MASVHAPLVPAAPGCSAPGCSTPFSPSSSGSSDVETPCSRKRPRWENEWKSSLRKRKRNSGEAYVSKAGKEVRTIVQL